MSDEDIRQYVETLAIENSKILVDLAHKLEQSQHTWKITREELEKIQFQLKAYELLARRYRDGLVEPPKEFPYFPIFTGPRCAECQRLLIPGNSSIFACPMGHVRAVAE